MVFRPRQRRQTLDISIQIDNNNIDCVKETVFLGVILDEHISWKPHILGVSRKNIKIYWYYLQVKFLPSQNFSTLFVL